MQKHYSGGSSGIEHSPTRTQTHKDEMDVRRDAEDVPRHGDDEEVVLNLPRQNADAGDDLLRRLGRLIREEEDNGGRRRRWNDDEHMDRRPREFKLPSYDGKTDVELFIQEFEEIRDANDWNRGASRLHLKGALVDSARDCGRPPTLEGVLDALRARFGLTTREARAKLASLRKEPNTTLQEHGVEVERLVGIAYADLEIDQREEMTMDLFVTTLGHLSLQRHMLAVRPADLAGMIQAGNEFLQLQTGSARGRHSVQTMDEADETHQQVAPVNPVADETNTILGTMMKVLQGIVSQLQRMDGPVTTNSKGPTKLPPKCWNCGEVEHVRRDCKKVPHSPPSGNGPRPQQ